MDRREFVALLGGCTVAGAVAGLAGWSRVPVIYADGEHDDSEGLQAFFDGKPFRMADGRAVDRKVFDQPARTIRNAKLRLTRTIRVSDTCRLIHCHIIGTPGIPLVNVPCSAKYAEFSYCYLDGWYVSDEWQVPNAAA